MEYWAHSENKEQKKHPLSKHGPETADLAKSFACRDEFKAVFYVAGLLHDLGKYQPQFQRYLENGGKRGSVPHASWGAGYARRNGLIDVSIPINGHHKGLSDNAVWKSNTEPFKRGEVEGLDDVVRAFLGDTGIDESIFKEGNSPMFPAEPLRREAFMRYLFSALTDSDWLSTEKHFDKTAFRVRTSPKLPVDEMLGRLHDELSIKPQEGEINRMRNGPVFRRFRKQICPAGFIPWPYRPVWGKLSRPWHGR